jgi:flavin-binding protein dodecin
VKHADDDMKAKQYSSARFYYGKAKNILPWEVYPNDQLKVVEKLISSSDNGIEAQYFDAIQKADDAVTQKNIAIARFYYQKAVSLKPNEDYPKQQLKRLSSEK